MYSYLLRRTFQLQFQYRGNMWIGMLGSILRVYIQVAIWTALLSAGAVNGVTLSDMITFTILSLALRMLTRFDASYIVSDKVQSGAIAIDFIRPINLRNYMFFEAMSDNFFSLCFNGAPIMIIAALAWGMNAPDLANLGLFFVSLALGVALMFLYDYIWGIMVFWIKGPATSNMIAYALFTIFSGATIPLWFYPGWLANVCAYLPFRLVTFEPIAIYLGKYSFEQSLAIIGSQVIWVGVFFLLERLIWSKLQKTVFVQGG